MNNFYKKLASGEIQFRDNWQFELKSEFPTIPEKKDITHTQEFYFFIPNSLQINHKTYSPEHFYRDQTNFIRFKTPIFSI